MFIDATYEGDLMAAAGVAYHVGREASSVYGEEWNGIQVGTLHHAHWFKGSIDPYRVPGDRASGLLPRISADPPGQKGDGDKRIQAYCFRMCLSCSPENRLPFPKPADYDARQYELLLRVFATGWRETFHKFDPIPNCKTDTNNHGPFSTDNIGYNYDYPEGSYARRREIIAEHESYQKGLMYFLANDPRVPADVHAEMSRWGLPKDEFLDNGHWPHQLYIREARRMIGRFVMTENELLKRRPTPESIGMGSYTMDSHNVQRYVTPEGYVQNEGDIGCGHQGPLRDRLRRDRPQGRTMRQSARARVRQQLAHRLRLDAHGARVHDSGSVGRHRGRHGLGRQRKCAACSLRRPSSTPRGRRTGSPVEEMNHSEPIPEGMNLFPLSLQVRGKRDET